MRKILLILLMNIGLFANTQPYKKDIVLEKITKPTLVQVELDNEIYKNTLHNYSDVRLRSKSGVEGYFIKSLFKENILNRKTLTATSYDRKNAKLTYGFKKPFDIEKIYLNIEDRNFESTVDVYVDGALVLENEKIFDYSNETGTRNFMLNIPRLKVKELSIVYHLDQTTSFYKKYQNLKELSKYLTIKSITVSNSKKVEKFWNKTELEPYESSTDEKNRESSYIIKTNNIPFSKISVGVKEKNFKRSGTIYISDDAKEWHSSLHFSLSASTLSQEKHTLIECSARTKYIKLVLFNADNKPLVIENIELYTQPAYLYFIANPNENYGLYFGDKNLKKPSYELRSLVQECNSFVKANFSKIEALEVERIIVKHSFFELYKEQIFMIFILFAVGVLGYVAFGLLKRDKR